MISEKQLETWSNRGSLVLSQKTHDSIRNYLSTYRDFTRNYQFKDYLQGSYKNYTNIRGDSDVDIVIQLNSIFQSDLTHLSDNQKNIYTERYEDAIYKLEEFKTEIYEAIVTKFGQPNISLGNKSIKVKCDENGNRLNSDVVVCMQFRCYKRVNVDNDEFDPGDENHFDEGILFYDRSNNKIVNYPKLHFVNGNKKNDATNGNFRQIVRIFKNARNYLINNSRVSNDTAPSYFVECLLYNVPTPLYSEKSQFQGIISAIMDWLTGKDWIDHSFICQNGIVRLLGDNYDQWNVDNARLFVECINDLFLE